MFHDRLKITRESRGWTQDQLAEKSDVGVATIRRYETGNHIPKRVTPTIRQLAETLGINAEWLFSGSGYKTHKDELIAKIKADDNLTDKAKIIYRLKLKYELFQTIKEIYFPDLFNSIISSRLSEMGIDESKVTQENAIDILTNDEILSRFLDSETKMQADIDNYIATRTKKFIDEFTVTDK